ncbi:MAG: cell division protein FtsH, partial [Spirochaetia bacterium]|nr:cell division protein FtsH [Spirochaetia bacterium]
MNKNLKFLIVIVLIVFVIMLIFQKNRLRSLEKSDTLTFYQFSQMLTTEGQEKYGKIFTKFTETKGFLEDDPFILRISPKVIEGRYIKPGIIIEPTDDAEKLRSKTIPFEVESLPGTITPELLDILKKNQINYILENRDEGGILSTIFSILPFILLIGILWMFMMRQIQSTGNRALAFGKSKAKLSPEGKTSVTFHDVAGCD